MGNDNSLLIVVLAVIAYLVITAKQAGKSAIGAALFGAEAPTPSGTITATGAAGAVKEITKGSCLGYLFNPVMYAACIASQTVVQSPQTPAPTKDPYITAPVELCPCNNTMLLHDRRCCQPEQTGGYAPEVFAEFSPEHQAAYR